MPVARVDHVSAGYIFAYDGKTGHVLWTHEKVVEVIPGRDYRPSPITDADCERVRAEAAKAFRDRDVKAMAAPREFGFAENVRIRVNPSTRMLETIPETRKLADRLRLQD